MLKAIAESCNVYFWTIGGGYGDQKGLGPSRIKKYLELFGWGNATGIDLPGEASGFIPDQAWKNEQFAGTQDQVWGDGDTYNLAIGQGFIAITPLQVASAYVAIANGGKLYKPQMVHNIVDSNKNIIEEKTPQIIRENFIDAQNLQSVREGMRHGVNGANAPLASSLILNSLGVPMGAKTGTAQVRKGADGKDILYSWVSVFAPYDDPKIVLTVMMEDVREGQMAVLPVAKEVLGWYFAPKETRNASLVSEPAVKSDQPANPVLPASPAQIEEQLKQIQNQVEELRNSNLPQPLTKPEPPAIQNQGQ
jgi:penicillin-binding protein 2